MHAQAAIRQSMADAPNSSNDHPGSGEGRGPMSHRIEEEEDDDFEMMPSADEDLAFLSRLRDQAMAASREASGMVEGMTNVTRAAGLPTMFPDLPLPGATVVAPPFLAGPRNRGRARASARVVIEDDDDEEDDVPMGIAQRARQPTGGNARPGMHFTDHEIPEGMDAREVEEARMLEAALLGVPYEGRMPDFERERERSMNRGPVDPVVMETRNMRWEQDQAYEESLAADRAKAEAVERAKREQERQEREAREAEEAERKRIAHEERMLEEALERKKKSLPSEPSGEEAGFNVIIRMPDGSRLSRRFRPSDPLQAVFDFLDITVSGIKPRSYNLATSYPRKVLTDGTSSTMEETGLKVDTVLMFESSK